MLRAPSAVSLPEVSAALGRAQASPTGRGPDQAVRPSRCRSSLLFCPMGCYGARAYESVRCLAPKWRTLFWACEWVRYD
ncbi:hypothetical protein GQ53DRAFT_753458 [Thozetella sp. PMI_491]|nr:hypothetical protein GQ53DRAFT_753458 [Thozetella sp. PMI_491]